MFRVPNRGWIPPSTNGSPSSPPRRRAVPARPSGPAAYERWSSRIPSLSPPPGHLRTSGVRLLCDDPAEELSESRSHGTRRRLDVAGKSGGSQAGKGERGPVARRCDAIRNVVLVGPAGSGKTTLVETLLVSAGVLSRAGSTVDGTTVTDFEDAEHRQQRSVGLALAPLLRDGTKINLLDTPGYADFVGELRAGLRAADCAMFVIAANEGIDEQART